MPHSVRRRNVIGAAGAATILSPELHLERRRRLRALPMQIIENGYDHGTLVSCHAHWLPNRFSMGRPRLRLPCNWDLRHDFPAIIAVRSTRA